MHRLSIDLDELIEAFTTNSPELRFYLDRESGAVVLVDDEARAMLAMLDEATDDEHDEEQTDAAEGLAEANVPEWMREGLHVAREVERGSGERYIAIPPDDSHEAYRDMEDFTGGVRDRRLQARLLQAIQGRGAFRRFKDVLRSYPAEREAWFAFSEARVRERALAWLESEEISVVEGTQSKTQAENRRR